MRCGAYSVFRRNSNARNDAKAIVMHKKTPQEKKRLSYLKDRRNTYGESDKGSRKTIRKNKRFDMRAERRRQDNRLRTSTTAQNVDQLTAAEMRVKSALPRRWRKNADAPLGIFLTLSKQSRRDRWGSRIRRRLAAQVKQDAARKPAVQADPKP
jgi:hypothetical protein